MIDWLERAFGQRRLVVPATMVRFGIPNSRSASRW
jgi:hypothetical protein